MSLRQVINNVIDNRPEDFIVVEENITALLEFSLLYTYQIIYRGDKYASMDKIQFRKLSFDLYKTFKNSSTSPAKLLLVGYMRDNPHDNIDYYYFVNLLFNREQQREILNALDFKLLTERGRFYNPTYQIDCSTLYQMINIIYGKSGTNILTILDYEPFGMNMFNIEVLEQFKKLIDANSLEFVNIKEKVEFI